MAENTVLMEGVRIIFRNFEGKEGRYNKPGSRNFGVILPSHELAHAMLEDDWNVKWLEPREEDEEETEKTPWLPVEVDYVKGRPPRIVLITSRKRRQLAEADVEMLDGVDIVNVDMIVRPYNWNVNDKGGVKAYLQTMYITIEEDELEKKYGEMEDNEEKAEE